MPKKRKVRRNEVEGFYITVDAVSASASRHEPDRRYSDGESCSSITLEGTIEKAVVGRTKALISIHEARDEAGLGSSIGLSDTHWQVVAFLPEPQFSHAMMLAAANRFAYCYVAVRAMKRGVAPIVSVGFNTAPVPILAGEAPV